MICIRKQIFSVFIMLHGEGMVADCCPEETKVQVVSRFTLRARHNSVALNFSNITFWKQLEWFIIAFCVVCRGGAICRVFIKKWACMVTSSETMESGKSNVKNHFASSGV